MPATIYYENDADLSLLKDKTIAILGYGNQGRSQALNLRDSGLEVIVGSRSDGSAEAARADSRRHELGHQSEPADKQ